MGEEPTSVPPNSIQFRYDDDTQGDPWNDPRKPYALDTDDIDKFPVYIRYVLDEKTWLLELAEVRVNPTGDHNQDKKYKAPKKAGDYFRLGERSGKIAYLLPVPPG